MNSLCCFVEGQIRFWHVEVEEIVVSCKGERLWLDEYPGVGEDHVLDVVGAVGVKGPCILHGSAYGSCAMNFGEGENFLYVTCGLEVSTGEFGVVLFCMRRESEESPEEFLGFGVSPLGEKLTDVVRVFDVDSCFIASEVPRDESVLVVDAEAIWVRFNGETYPCVFGGNGVAVGIELYSESSCRTNGVDYADIISIRGEWQSGVLVFGEKIYRSLFCLSMQSNISD